MKDAGIDEGDVLVIDRSLESRNGAVAVCFLDGEFTVKRISITPEDFSCFPQTVITTPSELPKKMNSWCGES